MRPPIWKPTIGKGLKGELIDVRCIRGVVVLDVRDASGRVWTSPTASAMAQRIVEAMRKVLFRPGLTVEWFCEGRLPSLKGEPHWEFSFAVTNGKDTPYEKRILRFQASRDRVANGDSLEKVIEDERKLLKELGK